MKMLHIYPFSFLLMTNQSATITIKTGHNLQNSGDIKCVS